MMPIAQLFKELEVHDSTLQSLKVDWDGAVNLTLDIDEVWNKGIDPNISGIRFPSVYEIVSFKIDRMNIIESVEYTDINDYDRKFVVHDTMTEKQLMMVDFNFVAGGRLSLVCSDAIEYLKSKIA